MKTQTAEEILMDYLNGEKGKGFSERYAIIAAMEEYAQQQLKILNIPVVRNSFCPRCGSENLTPYNTPSCECKDCKAYWAI